MIHPGYFKRHRDMLNQIWHCDNSLQKYKKNISRRTNMYKETCYIYLKPWNWVIWDTSNNTHMLNQPYYRDNMLYKKTSKQKRVTTSSWNIDIVHNIQIGQGCFMNLIESLYIFLKVPLSNQSQTWFHLHLNAKMPESLSCISNIPVTVLNPWQLKQTTHNKCVID